MEEIGLAHELMEKNEANGKVVIGGLDRYGLIFNRIKNTTLG